MNKIEKIAIAKLVSDLIKADAVIDRQEMTIWNTMLQTYRITAEHLADARHITFAEALNSLQDLDCQQAFIDLCKSIVQADGLCNKHEALLILSIGFCLHADSVCQMIQVEQQGIQVEDGVILYVETQYDEAINREITTKYYEIEHLLQQQGLTFAYIPKIAEAYQQVEPELFQQVLRFLSPVQETHNFEEVITKITSMTTATFCQQQLCSKLGMRQLADTPPALLIKTGDTQNGEKTYTNYLKLELSTTFMDELQQLLREFSAIHHAEYALVRTQPTQSDKFVYSGVYKQILDLCLLEDQSRSTILIDTLNMKILFPEIHEELKVSKSSKALYVLYLLESVTGGISLGKVDHPLQMKHREAHLEKLKKKYEAIYHLFGGNTESTPDIADYSIRGPKTSKINKALHSFEEKLSAIDDYTINHTADGVYKINIDSNMVYCLEDDKIIPWMQSERWKRLM